MNDNREQRSDITEYARKRQISVKPLAGILGFLLVYALPVMFSAKGDFLWYTNSVFSLLLWLLFFCMFCHMLQKGFEGSKKRWLIPGLLAMTFSACMAFGAQLECKESVTFTDTGMWMNIGVLTVCFSIVIRFCWDGLSECKKKWQDKLVVKDAGQSLAQEKCGQLRSFLLTAVAIFLCYVPVFLAVYPGFFVYDAQDELMQVITRNFSTHHPLLHVLLLGGIIQLVYKITDSYNLGIACYTLFQMITLSGIFSVVICRLKNEGMRKGARIGIALYFGLFPTIVMFSLCSAKDGLFTGMVLLMVVLLRELISAPETFFEKKAHVLLLSSASLMMILLRHNGFYAFIVFAVFLAFTCKMTGICKIWKKALVLFVVVLVGYFLISTGMKTVLQADDSENQELLTVPIQQMARVYVNEKDVLSQEDINTLYEVLPKEALERYVPKVSDGVKVSFNNEAFSADKTKYLKLWIKWGAEHPFTYLNAWFMTSYGFWYPDTVIDVYRGNSVFTYTYEDSSYFGFEVEQPGERESKLPLLEESYRRMSLEITQQKVPVISMLFSPGCLFWVMMFAMGFFWYSQDYRKLFPYVLPLLLWLTVILGPTYLVRYVVFLWFLLPVMVWDLIIDNNCAILTHG